MSTFITVRAYSHIYSTWPYYLTINLVENATIDLSCLSCSKIAFFEREYVHVVQIEDHVMNRRLIIEDSPLILPGQKVLTNQTHDIQ